MRARILLALAAVALGVGCVVVHDEPGGTPPGGTPPGNPPLYRIAVGASTIVYPGTQAGYGLTAGDGSAFRVVWTGDAQTSGTYREFTGSITTSGHFTAFTPGCNGDCPLEANDVINAPAPDGTGGELITFDTIATVGLDGLDFAVSEEPVYFSLSIDGAQLPSLVFFPDATANAAIASVTSIPFGLVTR